MLAFSLTCLMEILGILPGRTITDEILHNKAFNIKKKNRNMMNIVTELPQWVINFLDKKTALLAH